MSDPMQAPMIFPAIHPQLRLGLGGAALGNLFTAVSDESAHAVLEAAVLDGCRSFDTAPHYGQGLSEHRFGRALRVLPRDSFALSTKVGRVLQPRPDAPRSKNGYVDVLPFEQQWDFSATGVRRSVEDSLQRLGLARLDVALVHDCDATTHGARYPQVLHQVVHQALPEMRRMQSQGLLRHVGLGVNDVQVCLDVMSQSRIDCLVLAGRYTLIDHTALAELLPMCQQEDVRIALGGVFNSGILATGLAARAPGQPLRFNYTQASAEWIAKVARIEALCQEFGVPLRAAAMQFPLAHAAIGIVLAGAQTPMQWQDACAMLSHPIDAGFWHALRRQRLLPDLAPTP